MQQLPDLPVFYAPVGPDLTGIITIDAAEFRHAVSVLRLESGSGILVSDGNGRYYECRIDLVGKKSLSARVSGMVHRDRDSEYDLILAFALIKNRQRLEWMLEKATELGVSGIVLFKSARSERDRVRTDRLENILVSALKQSKRFFLPRLSESNSIEEVIEKHPGCELIVAHEKTETAATLPIAESRRKLLFIGPEGGFTNEEIATLTRSGAKTISLGSNRLRAETAALALLAKFV
ncbi:MAG: RsmE family RNA methyltransferase [Cyclonatronaceae bacterium]